MAILRQLLMVWGLGASRKERGLDRRHSPAFVGFCAAVTAVTATTIAIVAADLHPHSMSSAWQGLGFVTGTIAIIAILVTFVAGFLSRRTERIGLVSAGIVIALMYLFALVGHFGD